MKEEYSIYTAIDFSLEPDFIDWVKNEVADAEWQSWMKEHPEVIPVVEEAKDLILNIQFETVSTKNINRKKLWKEIARDIKTPSQIPNRSNNIIRKLFIYSSAAAAVAVLIFFVFFKQGAVQINTFAAEQTEKILPDGSSVQLNALSQINYDKKTWKDERRIQLAGEAYFDVEKGNTFLVETDLGTVEVLGTSFNIFVRENDFEVICTSGKVKVSDRKGTERILSPGEQVNLLESGELSTKLENVEAVDWLAGVYKFSNEQIGEVVKVLERQFDINIDIDDTSKMLTYTGSFETKSLEQALYSVFWPLKLEYSISGKEVSVK